MTAALVKRTAAATITFFMFVWIAVTGTRLPLLVNGIRIVRTGQKCRLINEPRLNNG